ncbi:MAG TPA: sulfite exporter TauE/SafE family protein [Terriglobia bacterium]|nr:sulfite exporter TauE/SafE family protein [Terriglobia bacterium]
MVTWSLTLCVLVGCYFAGLVRVTVGMGGGIILVQILILHFRVNSYYAVGASLVSVTATSSGGTVTYFRKGYTNLRIGMFLVVAASAGGVLGALISERMPPSTIAAVFAVVLLFCGVLRWRRREESEPSAPSDRLAQRLHLEGSSPVIGGWHPYHVYHFIRGFLLKLLAGGLSGPLGIGAGAVNVLSMDQVMRLPYRVSSTASNFMIGITAAASGWVYFSKGFINPGLTMPAMLGVFLGAMIGAEFLAAVKSRSLRMFFSVLVFLMAAEMIYSGLLSEHQ